MNEYTLAQAQRDMAMVRKTCGRGKPDAAIAFAIIVRRLLRDLSVEDFSGSSELMAFVFTGLYSLRDWVFNTVYEPSTDEARSPFRRFDSGLRLRLMECNGGESYSTPRNIDGYALWDFVHDEFLPVVDGIRASGDATKDLGFLQALT